MRYLLALFILTGLLSCSSSTDGGTGPVKPDDPPVTSGSFCGTSTHGKCESDNDCYQSGCSSHFCQSVYENDIISTCEWTECYDAAAYNAGCGCTGGECQWSIN